jgi:predicted RNA-binding Zn-ribbon protein involved in translation (DUF1610 family)
VHDKSQRFDFHTPNLVIMRTMIAREPREVVSAGTLAGAGCFRCQECGFAVALHERDEIPTCPHCGAAAFKRSSIFGELALREPTAAPDPEPPTWLHEARDAIDDDGAYLAYDEDARLRVVRLEEGWTRVGRSLSANIRFDDPTVSRRHALVHLLDGVVRILDDRSLNGTFVNGERVDLRRLGDGDALTIGRFCLYFMSLQGHGQRFRPVVREALA